MTRLLLPLALALSAACAGSGTVSATYSTPSGPALVQVRPGVYVLEDYPEPIFYADNFYWRFYGGVWYRSNYYTGGWVAARPTARITYVDRPYAYVRYRARPHDTVVIRDHRGRLHRRHR